MLRRMDAVAGLRESWVWSARGVAGWVVAVTVPYGVLAAFGVVGTVSTSFGLVAGAPAHGAGGQMHLGGSGG